MNPRVEIVSKVYKQNSATRTFNNITSIQDGDLTSDSRYIVTHVYLDFWLKYIVATTGRF